MTNSARRGGLLAVLSLCVLASTAVAGPARFVSIDFPGATATFAFGINPAGAIVGAYFKGGQEHAFVLRGGSFSSFDYPGAAWTEAYGIPANGDIVGQYGLGNGDTHGFLLRDGDFYPVDVPGQPSSMAARNQPEGRNRGVRPQPERECDRDARVRVAFRRRRHCPGDVGYDAHCHQFGWRYHRLRRPHCDGLRLELRHPQRCHELVHLPGLHVHPRSEHQRDWRHRRCVRRRGDEDNPQLLDESGKRLS